MDAKEYRTVTSRVSAYESAMKNVERYESVLRTLRALDGGEHTLGCVVVDVIRKEFRIVESNESRVGSRICSLEKLDQAEIYPLFIAWAIQVIEQKKQAALLAAETA